MTITCHLRLLLAKANVERARQGKPSLSLRSLAKESGVSLSVLASLHAGRSQRVDYTTIDRLLNYFSYYFNVSVDDLFVWEKPNQEEALEIIRRDASVNDKPGSSRPG
jgi:transcriptional regulator with XRE-family HTH domain